MVKRTVILSVAVLLLRAAAPAQDATEPAPPLPAKGGAEPRNEPVIVATTTKSTKSQNVTINLINRLVERGILSKEEASEMIKQAEADASEARAQADAVAALQANQTAGIPQPMQVPPPPDPEPDEVSVTYIPESVKAQLRSEIREDVMQQARDEKWAAPRTLPEWTLRYKLFGDIRNRYEGDFFPSGNDNTGAFPNFNAINTGSPFDITGTTFSPQLNVDRDRERFRLRLRGGALVDLGDQFTVGVRIATGENNTPTSTNQSLGLANNAQGGNFSKYAIWLDRAFLRYEVGGTPEADFNIWLGRFDNPWFNTDLIWDDDLGFDGIAVQGRYEVVPHVVPFITFGGFPVFNTDFNFASNRPDKFPSEDKWLVAVQGGVTWNLTKHLSAKAGLGYYDFVNVAGRLSDPFVPLTASDQGNTDDTRPAFAQKGNTYFPIRNISPVAENNFDTTKQFQFFGLASSFRPVTVTGQLDWGYWDPFHVALQGEYIENTAWDYTDINSKAVNNRGANLANGNAGPYVGGNTAWIVGLKVGAAALEKRWDWNVGINYRYIESDAVVDGFNDSDFGLGGTNLKGWSAYGSLALSPRVALFLRWMSADEVAGPKYSSDILQFDVNAKF